ncbi:MAG: ParB/RepB/Spo0J family partition protein [Oscillospiraceae bacterium]|nr:ParB/RepB/Spo0J family partition protein [Oscillospiraceae bacterium]
MEENYLSPVYDVMRIPIEKVQANSYNPNRVSSPEMKLLVKSILEDGYTMPVVCYYIADDDMYEIVDGFHRYLVMKTCPEIAERESNHLPVSVIDKPLSERIASTIRHNRARGTHNIDMMVDIIAKLTEAGLSDSWIMKNIGMDADELLRLKQISGLASLFAGREFSMSWKSDKTVTDTGNMVFENGD